MADTDVSARMRDDWNLRAREDAGYYVAFGRRDQDDAEFLATATDVINKLERELRRVAGFGRPGGATLGKALEIGCGPGRLMRPLSRHFSEIHGVDVSDEMIALATEKLHDIPHAHLHVGDGSRLTQFADNTFDFVYSYAVFQHIPSRDVVMEYFRETQRVLKPGGLARLQINGLRRGGYDSFDTWSGARFSASEILEFTQDQNLQTLALEGAWTQYMWTTWRKQPAGWFAAQQERRFPKVQVEDQMGDAPVAEFAAPKTMATRIRRITNAQSSEPIAPCRGRFASISLWVDNLPIDAGLGHLRVSIGDAWGTPVYVGAPDNIGTQQITVMLPELETTGLLPVELHWMDQPIAPVSSLRIIPPGPSVPCLCAVTDGVNLVAGHRIETRHVKMTLEEIAEPQEIEATVGGLPVLNLEYFCVDPKPQKFEVNFQLPEEIVSGVHQLIVRLGRRKLAPVMLEIAD